MRDVVDGVKRFSFGARHPSRPPRGGAPPRGGRGRAGSRGAPRAEPPTPPPPLALLRADPLALAPRANDPRCPAQAARPSALWEGARRFQNAFPLFPGQPALSSEPREQKTHQAMRFRTYVPLDITTSGRPRDVRQCRDVSPTRTQRVSGTTRMSSVRTILSGTRLTCREHQRCGHRPAREPPEAAHGNGSCSL